MDFIVSFIDILFNVLLFSILGRVLISWVDPQGNMPITRFLHEITEPILSPIRSVIPSIGMFDLSPIVAMLLIQLVQRLILGAIG